MLAIRIRNNHSIRAICVGYRTSSFHLKLLQYADDTVFFVKDEESLSTVLKELNKFGEVAGPKLNKDKTTLTWIRE